MKINSKIIYYYFMRNNLTNIRQYASRPLIWYRETSKGGIMMRDISAFFYCVQKYTSSSLIVSHMETGAEEKNLSSFRNGCFLSIEKYALYGGYTWYVNIMCIPFCHF